MYLVLHTATVALVLGYVHFVCTLVIVMVFNVQVLMKVCYGEVCSVLMMLTLMTV
jgi:hypothetical protein